MSRLKQEKENFEYQRATYKIRRRVFCPTSRSRQESEGFFYQRATFKGRKYKKPRKPLSPPGLVCRRKEKKRERPRKVVCRHKKGTWKTKKKEKKKTKEGKKVAPPKARFRVPSTKNFFFGSRVAGFWETHLGWSIGSYKILSTRKPCAKEVPATDYLTQRKQYLKRTTLRTY